MLKYLAPLVHRQTLKFERHYNYDAHYLRYLFALSPRAFMRWRHVLDNSQFAQGVPAAALYTVKFVAIAREDCGPCAQLTLDQACEAGVARSDLQAWVAHDPDQLSADAHLAWDYAHAVLDHSPEASQWCERILVRWGEPALASLALALVTSRSFPAMKRALGVAQASCQLMEVRP